MWEQSPAWWPHVVHYHEGASAHMMGNLKRIKWTIGFPSKAYTNSIPNQHSVYPGVHHTLYTFNTKLLMPGGSYTQTLSRPHPIFWNAHLKRDYQIMPNRNFQEGVWVSFTVKEPLINWKPFCIEISLEKVEIPVPVWSAQAMGIINLIS